MQWDNLPGTGFEYYKVIQDGVEGITNIYTNTATIDGLIPNTCYGFQIQAYNSGGKGPPLCENQFATSNFHNYVEICIKKSLNWSTITLPKTKIELNKSFEYQ